MAREQTLIERRAVQTVGGDDPYIPSVAPNPKVLGVEITPDSPDKGLLRAGLEDVAQFTHGFIPGLAKLGTAAIGAPLIPFGDPLGSFETAKALGAGLVETGRKLIGVTGVSDVLGFEGEAKRARDYYKAHPGFFLLDASVLTSFGSGTILKSALGTIARKGLRTAIEAGAKEGVVETIIQSALFSERSILTRGVRGVIGASTKKIVAPLERAIAKAAQTGEVADIIAVTRQALMKQGVFDMSALKIAQKTATDIAESVARQTKKLKTLNAIEHPIGAIFKAVKTPIGAISTKIFGTPEQTAMGRVYGGVIKTDIESAVGMEKWAQGVLAQKHIIDTVDNRVKELMAWKTSTDFAGKTLQQAFDDFKNYVATDKTKAMGDKLSGLETVLRKVLDKSTTDTMIENLRGIFEDIKSEVETAFPKAVPEQKSLMMFDRVEKFMTKNSGYDFGKYSERIRAAFNKKSDLATLEKEIGKLSSRLPSLDYAKISPEAVAFYKKLEGTGWRADVAPLRENLIQVSDVVDGVGKTKQLFVGITSATDKIPEIKALGEKANALEKAGDFVGANKIHNQILDKGEATLKGLFSDMPEVKIKVQRAKGNFVGDSEATFQTEVTLPIGKIDEVVARLSEFADTGLKQHNIHISEVLTRLPKGSKMGVELTDGYIYEPNVDFRFSRPLTDVELNSTSKIAQELGLAGATFHADKQGINLYNISKFKNARQLIQQIKQLESRLLDGGILAVGERGKTGVRKLLNIGDAENGATRSYQNIRDTFRAKQEVIEPSIKEAGIIKAVDFETSRTGLGKIIDSLGFATRGVLSGTREFVFQNSFIQNAIEKLGKKHGATIRITRPTARTTTEGIVAGKSVIAIPVEKLYEWLNNHLKEFSDIAVLKKNVVFDIKRGDLVKFGFTKELANDIGSILDQSQRSAPASVVGAGEVMLNFLRSANPGFLRFGEHFDRFFRTANYMRYESPLSFAFQSQAFLETGVNASMLVKDPMLFPGVRLLTKGAIKIAEGIAGLGERITPGKLGRIFGETKTRLQKIIKKPTNVERVIMRDFLGDATKLEDVSMTPEYSFQQKLLRGGEKVKKIETALDISLAQKSDAFWLNMWRDLFGDKLTIAGKGIAEKFGMTLEEAGKYSEKIVNGKTIKIYKNMEASQAIRDMAETLITYKQGFQTSPLIRTLNLVWFPMRFQVKTTELVAKWVGSLSPTNRAALMSEWSYFSNWVGTDEGEKWRETHQNLLYNILAYTTAYEQIGDTVDAVTRGQLFGGNTGLIGGVPFGFIFNIAQELALIGQDPKTLDPKTGIPFAFRKTPRELVSYATFVTSVEEFLLTLTPGMPLYTLSGGILKGVSWSSLLKKILDQGLGGFGVATGLLPGEDVTKGGTQLEREFERVPLTETRF